MVKHKAHRLTVALDSTDALAERAHQVCQVRKDVRPDGPLQMPPQSLDQVQARAVRRQPEHLEAITRDLEPLLDRLRVMESAVVADQADLPTSRGLEHGEQEDQEVRPALGGSDRAHDLACGIVHSAGDNVLLVLSGAGDFRWCADRSPQASQWWVPVELDFIWKDQSFRGILLQDFFFNGTSCWSTFP
jgi:hypothetical protein